MGGFPLSLMPVAPLRSKRLMADADTSSSERAVGRYQIMQGIGSMLAGSGRLALAYAERLLSGVSPEMFGRFARVGGQVIRSNHPAFVFGHLALYPPRILELVGQPAVSVSVPPHYESLFKAGCECQDDVDGTIYPPMDDLTARFFEGYRAACAAVEACADEVFRRPNPAQGRMRELFPALGGAIGFYLGGHVQNHLGQFSAWRRAMGLPAAT